MTQQAADEIKFLEGKRVYLRPIEREDLDWLYQSLWNPEMRRLTGTHTVFTKAGLHNWFEKISTDPERIDLLICLQKDGQPIGDIAMLDIDHHHRKAHVRIAISNDQYLGSGYGAEAMRLLIKHGFYVLNLHRIALEVFAYNARAIRAYEKLGFKREGVIRDDSFYDGKYHDLILMSMLEDEFQEG